MDQRATIELDSAGGYELRLNLQEVLQSLDADAARKLADSLCVHDLLVERVVTMIVDDHFTDTDGEWWETYSEAITKARRTLSERHCETCERALLDAEHKRQYDVREARREGISTVLRVVRALWGEDDAQRILKAIRDEEDASRATPGGG